MGRPKKIVVDVKKIEAVADAITVLQDHGEACGCWECAAQSKVIEDNQDITALVAKLKGVK